MILNNFIRQRSRNYVIVVCICLLTTLTMLGGCTASGNGKAEKVRQGITAYLQQKYGIEFEVGQPYLTGSMSTTHYEAKAHPKGKPEIEFNIKDNSWLDNPGSGGFADYYLEAKWSYQGRKELEKKLREVYGEEADFRVRGYEFGGGSYALKDLDYAQVFEKTRGNGRIYLAYDIFMDSTLFIKETEAKKTFDVIKPFVLDYGSNRYTISVLYVDRSAKQDYLANPNPYIDKSVKHNYPENKEKTILDHFWLRTSASKSLVINSDRDIIEFSEY